MTISFDEAFEKRDVTDNFEEYEFEAVFIVRTDTPGEIVDEGTVRDFALLNMPLAIDGVSRNAITAIEFINEDTYRVKLGYLTTLPDDEEDEEVISTEATDSFDTTGGRELITYGISRSDAAGNISAELGAAINYDGDKVNGVEITVPRFGFAKTVRLPVSQVTDSYVKTILELTGGINTEPFGIFLAREVLFMGATASVTRSNNPDIEDEWELTFQFQGQQSRVNIVFNADTADQFTIGFKDGWDYIWVQYEHIEDEGQQKVVAKAIAAYVIKVYPDQTFFRLGFLG